VFAVGSGQVHAFGKTCETEQHARIPAINPRLVLVQGFLLGQVALDKHLLAPVAIKPVEHVLHLLARRKQHEGAARTFHQLRQVANDRRSMRWRVPWIGFQVGNPQHASVGMMERAGDHRRHGFFRQPGTHAKTVEGAQGGQCRRGHQGTVSHIPEVASEHFRRQDRAGVDLDVEQRAAFGQGQPARHRRVVVGVLGGERGPQLPVARTAGQEAAEQRVPLFGLVAGDANVDFAVHAFLQQFGETVEHVIQAGEAFLQLDAHFPHVLGNHSADKAMPWSLTTFDVFARLEIGHLLTGGKHELLLGLDFPREFRHLLDQLAEVAWQRVLGE